DRNRRVLGGAVHGSLHRRRRGDVATPVAGLGGERHGPPSHGHSDKRGYPARDTIVVIAARTERDCVVNRRTLTRSFLVATATGVALPGALRAQTPSASPVSSGDIRLAEIEGIALGLSPDGTMIAGVGKEDRFLVWDAETYETVARSEPMPEISIIDHTSVAWSPDSTALAWSLDAARLMLDSDIYVFDIDSGQITNLTDDEPTDQDAVSLMDDKVSGLALDVDLYPSWSADGESLYFARSTWEDVPEIATSLWRIPRDGGDATEIAVLSPDAPLLVSSIYAGMEDGSVLYATWPVDSDG